MLLPPPPSCWDNGRCRDVARCVSSHRRWAIGRRACGLCSLPRRSRATGGVCGQDGTGVGSHRRAVGRVRGARRSPYPLICTVSDDNEELFLRGCVKNIISLKIIYALAIVCILIGSPQMLFFLKLRVNTDAWFDRLINTFAAGSDGSFARSSPLDLWPASERYLLVWPGHEKIHRKKHPLLNLHQFTTSRLQLAAPSAVPSSQVPPSLAAAAALVVRSSATCCSNSRLIPL